MVDRWNATPKEKIVILNYSFLRYVMSYDITLQQNLRQTATTILLYIKEKLW